jgi:predicted amidophosphoribosyltransferase
VAGRRLAGARALPGEPALREGGTVAAQTRHAARAPCNAPRAMLENVLARLVALVVPPVCLACAAAPTPAHELLCGPCRRALPWLTGPCCPRCALPAPCAPCPARRAAHAAAWSPVAYAGPARDLVLALKARGALPAARLMAAQLAAGAPQGLLAGATLVPVPAHPARRRARGHDQADTLVRALAARTGLPAARCLRRHGGAGAARQVGATRGARVAQGRHAIGVRGRPPPIAALVDDVHTTGSTLDACARALRDAGTERVVALAYARTLRR